MPDPGIRGPFLHFRGASIVFRFGVRINPTCMGPKEAGQHMRDGVVIVTGANRGIGREIAHAFANEGATVVLAARSVETLERVREELTQKGAQAVAVSADVSVQSDVERLVDAAWSIRGRIDVLVNNAGIAGPTVSITELRPEDWHAVLDSNLTSCYLCCRAVVPHMIKQRFGRIINISSISGKRPLAFSRRPIPRAGGEPHGLGAPGPSRGCRVRCPLFGVAVGRVRDRTCPGSRRRIPRWRSGPCAPIGARAGKKFAVCGELRTDLTNTGFGGFACVLPGVFWPRSLHLQPDKREWG